MSVCPTTPVLSIYRSATDPSTRKILSNLFVEALGLTEPPVDRHLHSKPVCTLHYITTTMSVYSFYIFDRHSESLAMNRPDQ